MSVFTIFCRSVKWRFYHAFTIVVTMLQPVLWLVLYSSVASQTMKGAGIEDYTAFILPGLMVLTGFSACSSGGMMNYMMKRDGSFYRVLISPAPRGAIVLGHILEAVLCAFLEITMMALIGLLFSVRPVPDLPGVLAGAIFIFLAAFFMAGLSYGVSLVLPDEATYQTAMNAVALPVFFLSSALFPAEGLSGPMRTAVNLNPFTHVINGLRSVMLEGRIEAKSFVFVLCLFAVLDVLSFVCALRSLEKETV